jgi:hypothetical protein
VVSSSAIAPLVGAWQLRMGGQPGPYEVASASGVASGGYGPNGLLVELFVDGSWVDITQRVMVRDSGGQISITRGQSAEGQQPTPGTCIFQLNNRDELFSLSNPMSPYYGKISLNTQIRVSVSRGDDKNYRFWGEVPEWPEDWDLTGRDVWVDIEAAGILRRLNQGSTPLRSTMYRGLMSAAATAPVAYWPCEDGASSTSVASALAARPMTLMGSPSLASDTGFACSAALPVMNGGSLTGAVPAYAVTGESQVRFLMYLPSAPSDGTQLMRVRSGGTIPYWAIAYGTGGGLALRGLDTDGVTVLVDSGMAGFGIDDRRVRISTALTQNGTAVDWNITAIFADTGAVFGANGTFASQTVGSLTSVTASPGQTITDGVFGHISVQADVTSASDLVGPVTAFVGEKAADRISRLCLEEGINFVRIGANSTDTMGPQLPAKFLDLVQECVDVDQGVLLERETAFGLAYQPRVALLNQGARLTVSYPGHQLAAVPKPVPGDLNLRNQVTVTRPTGSSATSALETGRLSTLSPPAGVGVYPDAPTLNVADDAALQQHAAWRVHLGTVAEPRYPAITFNMAHPAMAALRDSALRVLFGARIVVASPPSRIGGDISQIVIGIQETITHFEHRITCVCQPETPYRVGVRDDTARGRRDSDGSYLVVDASPIDTVWQVATPAGLLWTTAAGDFPQDLMVGGEQVTVTAISGASSPQLFTVTRSVNGVTKTQAAGTEVHVFRPTIRAL